MRRIARHLQQWAVWAAAGCALALPVAAQVDSNLYAGLQWRNIGPFRGGRVSAVAGVSGQPGVYYMGTPGGGVWKTVDGGAVWTPIFDSVTSVSSIGSLAVAPSDTNVVYAGTGDVVTVGGSVNEGDGIYKSTDAGKTWHNIGLQHTHHVVAILVDPHDANLVLAATLGDNYSQSPERGLYRTTDGGATWNKVLFKDNETGVVSIAWADDDPKIVFAAFMRHYTPPPNPNAGAGAGRGARGAAAADSGPTVFRSSDEGLTWTPVEGGFPSGNLGRVGLAVADHTGGRRVYAIVSGGGSPGGGGGGRGAASAAGFYRSDDGGATWTKSTTDPRIVGSSYFGAVFVDTRNPDCVYAMQTSMYRSLDGGHTFIAFKGAPGGEDQHVLWIDPTDHQRMLMGSDQGATISLDGGETWTSWFNQANGQLYHVSTGYTYPYWVYATQQDNGALGTRSRGDLGQISYLDWWPIGGYEFGYIVEDPLNFNTIWVGAPAHGLARFDRTTWQWENVGPNIGPTDPAYRFATNAPLVFSPQDKHVLYEGTQFVSMTRDGGNRWTNISPDLAGGRGALDTVAPSTVQAGVIWAGSTTGEAHVTRDNGQTWQDVTPKDVAAFGDFSMIDAGHFDAGTAYAAVDQHLGGDYKPYIYRTHDYGKTWQLIVNGLPALDLGSFVRVVREDTVRRGLLFAGTEEGVYVSFDDGDHWQSLRLNLPTTSYRDMVIHGDDLVAATYGRALWILDDITPLRQITSSVASSRAYLFKPETAIRVRRSVNRDMPNPPEIPHGKNPPDGAIFDYLLASRPPSNTTSDIRLEVADSAGNMVRSFSNAPLPPDTWPAPNVPDFWLQKARPLPTSSGENRFNWDLRLAPPPSFTHNYPNAAIVGNTPAEPEGPLVPPGTYEVRLIVDGTTYRQPLTVVNDPRVTTPESVLRDDFTLQQKVYSAIVASHQTWTSISSVRDRLRALAGDQLPPDVAQAATALDASLAQIAGGAGGGRRGGGAASAPGRMGLSEINTGLSSLITTIEGADIPITEPQARAYQTYCGDLSAGLAASREAFSTGLSNLNALLTSNHLSVIPAPTPPPPAPSCN